MFPSEFSDPVSWVVCPPRTARLPHPSFLPGPATQMGRESRTEMVSVIHSRSKHMLITSITVLAHSKQHYTTEINAMKG